VPVVLVAFELVVMEHGALCLSSTSCWSLHGIRLDSEVESCKVLSKVSEL
jgi:hypothetical protein